jgi:hypothetical protein
LNLVSSRWLVWWPMSSSVCQRLGVLGGGEPVVQRLEADPAPLGLALGPLVAVNAHPQG